MRHMKELGAGAVRSHHPGAQRDAFGTSLDQEGGRAVAKKDAGVGVVVGQVMRYRIAGDEQHALGGPGGDEAQRRDKAQNAARAGRVEVKGGYGPQLQGMRDSGAARAQGIIRGKGGADQAVGPERRGVAKGLAGGAHPQGGGGFARTGDMPRGYSTAGTNPFRIDPQLLSQLLIVQYYGRKCLRVARDPESGSLQRKGSLLLHGCFMIAPECPFSR